MEQPIFFEPPVEFLGIMQNTCSFAASVTMMKISMKMSMNFVAFKTIQIGHLHFDEISDRSPALMQSVSIDNQSEKIGNLPLSS